MSEESKAQGVVVLMLEPCPHCESAGVLQQADHSAHPANGQWSAACGTYSCRAMVGFFDTPEDAVAAWNRRDPDDIWNALVTRNADLITLQATTIAEQAGEIERLTEDRGSWRRVSERLGTEKAALDALVSRLKEALERLANEVGGLTLFEAYIRAATGNTNWSVLMLRKHEAAALLSELGERGE